MSQKAGYGKGPRVRRGVLLPDHLIHGKLSALTQRLGSHAVDFPHFFPLDE